MNTYSIIMLGPRGSGKTVFLASLYKKLSTQGDTGFFLEVDSPDLANDLHNYYTEIAYDEQWPSSTRKDKEWIFNCQIQTNNLKIYSACKFTYLDYGGGRLTDYAEKENREFSNKVQNADIMLGLLDGQKIIALMQHEKQGSIWAINELPKMLSLMQRFEKPIQFVISKWDIVEDKYSLQDILDLLLGIEEFKNLVKKRNNAGIPIRIIPVSAVGKEFVTLQSDGSMVKNLNVLPRPFQVEVPLACVLPDLIQSDYQKIQKQKQDLENRNVEVKANLNFFDQVGQFVGQGLQGAQKIVPTIMDSFIPKKFDFATEIIQEMMIFTGKLAQSSAKKKKEIATRRSLELRLEREQSLKKVTDETTALRYCLECFALAQAELDSKFPESDIKLP